MIECEAQKRNSTKKKWKILIACAVAIVLVISCLLNFDNIGAWVGGFGYMNFGNFKRYACTYVQEPAVARVELDLSDLEANVGRVLYEQDGCRIEVRLVQIGESYTGGPIVYLNTFGICTGQKGERVSAVKHYVSPSYTFTATMVAKATCIYQGVVYECEPCGGTSLTRDGDMFYYYLFQADDLLDQYEGTAVFEITGLIRHTWTRL